MYTSIVEEHMTVRKSVGLFDVGHMGKILIQGDKAHDLLNFLSCNIISRQPGRARYTHLLRWDGCIIDDVIVTTLDTDVFLMICNAASREMVLRWLTDYANSCQILDLTSQIHCLALQGRLATPVLARLVVESPGKLDFFSGRLLSLSKSLDAPLPSSVETEGWAGFRIDNSLLPEGDLRYTFVATRTGYTGEDGFELFPFGPLGNHLWKRIIEVGRDLGLRPIGLGARDSLRLEKGYLLAGQDYGGGETPLETNLERIIKWDHEFIGRESLKERRDRGLEKILVGLTLLDRGVPRSGCRIFREGHQVGVVTSGGWSPLLRRGIGLGYVPPDLANPGERVSIRIRAQEIPSMVTKPPFV